MEIFLNDAPSSRVDGRKRGFRNYQLTNGYEVTAAPSRLFTIIRISSIIHLWPRSYPLIPFRAGNEEKKNWYRKSSSANPNCYRWKT